MFTENLMMKSKGFLGGRGEWMVLLLPTKMIKVKENNSIFLIINCSGEEGLGLDLEVHTEMIKAKQQVVCYGFLLL